MPEKKDSGSKEVSLPVVGMLLLGVLAAVVVAAQCEVIKFWPQPASVAPYFGPDLGVWWGLIAGGFVGLCVGFVVDDKNYDR
jgi:hypothetical protein